MESWPRSVLKQVHRVYRSISSQFWVPSKCHFYSNLQSVYMIFNFLFWWLKVEVWVNPVYYLEKKCYLKGRAIKNERWRGRWWVSVKASKRTAASRGVVCLTICSLINFSRNCDQPSSLRFCLLEVNLICEASRFICVGQGADWSRCCCHLAIAIPLLLSCCECWGMLQLMVYT